MRYNTQRLVSYAEDVKFADQKSVIVLENDFVRRGWYNFFEEKDMLLPEVQHYMMLTSIPYVIENDITFPLENIYNDPCHRCTAIPQHRFIEKRLFRPWGNLHAPLMVIGDAPSQSGGYGEEFDEHIDIGRVWVGAKNTCAILRKSLNELQLHTSTWYTNLLRRSLVGNAPSTVDEMQLCAIHLRAEIAYIKPQLILLLGSHVTKMWSYVSYDGTPTVSIYHPAYASRMNWTVDVYSMTIRKSLEAYGYSQNTQGTWNGINI